MLAAAIAIVSAGMQPFAAAQESGASRDDVPKQADASGPRPPPASGTDMRPSDAGRRFPPGQGPEISHEHKLFLSRLARRSVDDRLRTGRRHEPDYLPHRLRDRTCEVVVRLRHRGYLLAAASAGPSAIALAVRDAATTAAEMMQLPASASQDDWLKDALIEIEIVGEPEPVTVEGDWTKPRSLDPHVEPGVHGLVFLGPGLKVRFCPSEMIANDMLLADALKSVAQKSQADPSRLNETKLLRFRTTHWYQSGASGAVVSLHRGLSVVLSEDVAVADLDQSIRRLAEYMSYRQLPSGLFSYEFQPALDRYSSDDNLVRQVGATLAMCVHAAWARSDASLAAADLAIRYHLQGLTEFPGTPDAAYLRTADGENKLGVTALFALALAEHPHAEQYAAVNERFTNGMLLLQRPSGMFVTAFPPALDVAAQDYFPGEALVALAAQHGHRPSSKVLDAFDRAIDFYREYFRGRRSPALVPWQVQAYSVIARHAKRQDYVDYVFEMSDFLADKQLTRDNCPWPEMWGGIAAYEPGRAGVSTASYLEAFVESLRLARSVGDERRIRRYEQVVRNAARFVMQLQVRPEETYAMRSPQDAIGGIRTSPSLNLLRIDHCQHALIALIETHRVLFGDAK